MRIRQPPGRRGSLKWLQRAVAQRPDLLQPPGLAPLRWLSPLAADDFAEYRDRAFLERVGLGRLGNALAGFWPRGGPQWDGLAQVRGGVVLVEAKAHVGELASSCAAVSPASRARISASLAATREALGATPTAEWTRGHYQYANRLAHLWFLRAQGVDAHLLLVGFLGDLDMGGPCDAAAWRAAWRSADAALGLPVAHPLSPAIHHVVPHVRELRG